MKIGYLEIVLSASWVRSLKEKRMLVRSIIAKTRQKFNISVNEFATLDEHQTITLGITCGSNSTSQIDAILDQVVNFIESNYETEIIGIEREIL